jgi:hypothetical protein
MFVLIGASILDGYMFKGYLSMIAFTNLNTNDITRIGLFSQFLVLLPKSNISIRINL